MVCFKKIKKEKDDGRWHEMRKNGRKAPTNIRASLATLPKTQFW
jgi:hypothetical protein